MNRPAPRIGPPVGPAPAQRKLARSVPAAAAPGLATAHAPAGVVPLGPAARNGLPGPLKAGMERLSGIPLDDVRVYRNSFKPARLHAHAFAQGNEIHLGPGQDRHLPHKAWHVVQQRQGRVPTTGRIGSTPLNDDARLEAEADRMGRAARHWMQAQTPAGHPVPAFRGVAQSVHDDTVVQCVPAWLSRLGQGVSNGWANWRRGSVITDQRAAFNRDQPAPPARASVVGDTEAALKALNDTLAQLPQLRETVDALVALHADATLMEIQTINADPDPNRNKKGERKALYKDKRDLLALRLQIEKTYQIAIRAGQAMPAAALQQQVLAVKTAGTFLTARGAAITAMLTLAPASKTGRREPRNYALADNTPVQDRRIDVRAVALAQAVQADGFVPEVVVGLPTGGIQIAARIAGYFHAANVAAPKLMALRPRFVKPPGAGGAILPADQESINAADMTSAGMTHRLAEGAGPLQVLVVDDFSLSGSSVRQAKEQIEAQFRHFGRPVVVRTAVSRYTSGQIGGTIGAGDANPIDYMAGQHGTGTRAAVSAKFLIGDDRYQPVAAYQDDLGDADKGWLDEGEEALPGIGL